MKKIKTLFHKQMLWNAAAFIIPVFIFLIILYRCGFYPFGEKSMLIMDMQGQYVHFFASLRDALFGDNSLFFSWSRSMGGNYWGLLAYYVASPLSLITLFFPVKYMPVAMEVLTLLKLGLCGVSFFVFAKYLSRRCTGFLAENGRIYPFLLVLSVCYVFMSYNMVYSLSIMWLDGVILLPLILMGVEKILDGDRGLFYLITLAMLLISNYYTGYMVGLYTGMYFLFRILTSITKENWKPHLLKVLRFSILSALSIGISAPIVLGALKDLTQGKLSSGSQYTFDLSQKNFVFNTLLGKFKNGTYDSITNTGMPSIYCGYLALLLALAFLLLGKIKLREKIGMLLIIAILAASFYYTSLDTAWHGFQVPNWFPYRYAFLFSFSLLYMSCRTLTALPDWKKLPLKISTVCALLLLVVVPVEMGVNATHMLNGLDGEFHYALMSDFNRFIDRTKPLTDEIKEKDKDFYRVNGDYDFSKNDAMLLGYNGMTHYSSTYNAAINSLTPRLGLAQSWFWNSGHCSNIMLDSLFAVKYILSERAVPADYVKQQDTPAGTASYENPLALSIAYGCAPTTLSPDVSSGSPFVNQNNYFNAIAGTDVSYLTGCEYALAQDNNEWTYDFVAPSDNPMYLYMTAEGAYYADVYVNNTYMGNYFTDITSGPFFLGNFSQGEAVNVRVISYSTVSPSYSEIAELHMELLKPALQGLQENGMQIKNHKHGKLSGTITLQEGQMIMTSIPYDDGWTISIDGKKVTGQKFADTFLAIECPAGKHTIRMHYTSPGVVKGFVICIVSVLLAILYLGIIKCSLKELPKLSQLSRHLPKADSAKTKR